MQLCVYCIYYYRYVCILCVCVCVLCTAASKLFVLHVLRLCWLLDSTQWGRGNTQCGASHRLYVVGRVEADFAAFATLAPALLVLVLKLFKLVPSFEI